MNDDVREIVARVGMEAWGQEFSGDFGEPALRWDDIDEADQMSHRRIADAILAALAEAGYVVVANELLDTVDAFLGPKCANVNDDAWIWGVPDSRDHDNIVLDMRFWLNYFWPGKRHSLSEETP